MNLDTGIKHVAVLSGSQFEFVMYAEEQAAKARTIQRIASDYILDGVRFFFLSHAGNLRMLKDLEIVRVGNWKKRSDLKEVEQMDLFLRDRGALRGPPSKAYW